MLPLFVYKITLQRNPNRPRLARLSTHLDIVTYIKAKNLEVAAEIAQDMVKEHDFVDCVVENSGPLEFRREMQIFLSGI